MENRTISKAEILRNTLFHIQVNRCQYIDNFPEVVTSVLDNAIDKHKFNDYDAIKRKLYDIKTNFFIVNKIKKKKFFEELYLRLQNKMY